MPFEIPSRDEIRDRLILRVLGREVALSDYSPISNLRVVLEEMLVEEFVQLRLALRAEWRQWFIQYATGDNLRRRLRDYGMEAPAAKPAWGAVTVTGTVTVLPGQQVRTEPTDGSEPRRYLVQRNADEADGSWPITGSGDVRVEADPLTTAGARGNTAAGTITVLEGSAAATVTNAAPFANGVDAGDDDATRQAFWDLLRSLTRGTRDALRLGVLALREPSTGERVHSLALEEWGGVTLLDGSSNPVALRVYVEDGSGSASSTLVDYVQAMLDGDDTEGSGLRAAGVPTEVVSAIPTHVAVTVTVDVSRERTAALVQRDVENVIRGYFAGLPVAGIGPGGTVAGQVTLAQLFRQVMNVQGVLRAVFAEPLGDLSIAVGRKAVPATVVVQVGSIQ